MAILLTCPSCSEGFDLQLRPAPNLTRRIRCPACGEGALLVLDDFGRARLDILHTSQVGIESIVIQTSPPRDDAEDDEDGDGPESARQRKRTLSEGPSQRAQMAISSPSAVSAQVASPSPHSRPDGSADQTADLPLDQGAAPGPPDAAASLRLRPDLADATSRHRRALETRRDLPTVLPDGLAAPQVEKARTGATPTAAMQTEVARSPLLSPAKPTVPTKTGMSVLAMALLAAGVATLIGLGAWLALRVEAGIAAKEQDRAAQEAVASAEAQIAAVAKVAAAEPEPEPEPEQEPEAPAVRQAATVEPSAEEVPAPQAEPGGAPDPDADPVAEPIAPGATAPEALEPAPTPAPAADATHEVAGTSSDRESPWLALRESASASSQLLAQLPDGTGLRVLSRNKRWMRVQVLEGQDQGSIGWVNGRWVSHR